MSKIKVSAFSVSLDGFGAGVHQSLQNPLGVRGLEIHGWLMKTAVFQALHGGSGGTQGVDNDFARRSFENVGAWIIGRNMFGPVRGPWLADETGHSWNGWWGDEPPYHVPVFVLTNHPRPPLVMQANTTFYFVTGGIESALEQAKAAAQGQDIRIGGGVSTIRQYLSAGLVDEIHLALSPVALGEGENLFSGINLPTLGFKTSLTAAGEEAMHVILSSDGI